MPTRTEGPYHLGARYNEQELIDVQRFGLHDRTWIALNSAQGKTIAFIEWRRDGDLKTPEAEANAMDMVVFLNSYRGMSPYDVLEFGSVRKLLDEAQALKAQRNRLLGLLRRVHGSSEFATMEGDLQQDVEMVLK